MRMGHGVMVRILAAEVMVGVAFAPIIIFISPFNLSVCIEMRESPKRVVTSVNFYDIW